MGHSTLDITKEYVAMFGNDLQIDFEKFNPLDKLNHKIGDGNKIAMKKGRWLIGHFKKKFWTNNAERKQNYDSRNTSTGL